MNSKRFLVLLLAIALTMPAFSAAAFDDDEMTFEPDEVEDDEDAMTFAPDDLSDDDFDPDADIADGLDVGVVAVPGDDLSDRQRDELQDALRAATEQVPEIIVYGDSDLLSSLVERDADYCSRESLCLASVGRSAGVDRIVQARVERVDGSYRLDLDYFDVDDRLFVAYHSNSGLRTFGDVVEAVPPGVDDIFGIRRGDDDDPYVDDPDVNVPRVISYVSGGLSVAFLTVGTVAGLQLRSQQDELEQFRQDDGGYGELTQAEAHDRHRQMESSQTIANSSFVLGGLLGAASIALFIFSGDDAEASAAADDRNSSWYTTVDVAPQWSEDGFGVGATWNF